MRPRALLPLCLLFCAGPQSAGAAARSVEFTVEEGTWTSLDVSPDGSTIVFDLLGDLYTCPPAGGEATALTSGPAFDVQPRFSPDGRWLVFISDRGGADNVWVMRADGTQARQLTSDTHTAFVSPIFTPEGDGVLVSRQNPAPYDATFELWWYGLAGGAGVRVTQSAANPGTPKDQWSNAIGVVASADGRFLYYAHTTGTNTGGSFMDALPPPWQIIRRDRMTGEELTLTKMQGGAMRPALSPDGRWMSYATRHRNDTQLRLRDLKTGEDRHLFGPVQRDAHESIKPWLDLLPGYAFTPDGRALIAAWNGRLHRIGIATGSVMAIPFEARVTQTLGERPVVKTPLTAETVTARLVRHAALSPDGRHLAFTAFAKLHLMDFPGGAPRQLTADAAQVTEAMPAWSPDGRSLVYASWHPDEGGALWMMKPGARPTSRKITTDDAYYRDPVWSPDGTAVLAIRQSKFAHQRAWVDLPEYTDTDSRSAQEASMPDSAFSVVRIDLKGNLRHVANAPRATRPHFSADKTCIYVSSAEGLDCVRGDGVPVRRELTVKSKSVVGRDMTRPLSLTAMNPLGDTAAILFRGQLYLIRLARLGREITLDPTAPAVPLTQVTTEGADDFTWSADGRTLLWTLGSTVYSMPLTSIDWTSRTQVRAERRVEVTVQRPRARPMGTVVLRNARVVTMRGPAHDEVIPRADVIVTGDRIAGIAPIKNAAVLASYPASTRIIDASGKTIVPGFIDTHPHWIHARTELLDTAAWPLGNYLAYGVTTGRDPQARLDVFEYGDLVEIGRVKGPRILSTGPGVMGDLNLQSAADARERITRYARDYRTTTIKSYLVGDRRQRQWVMEAARQLGLMPTTEGGDDLKLQLTFMLDGFSGTEHNLPIAPLGEDVIQLMAASGIAYSPVILETYGGPWGFHVFYQDVALANDPKVARFFPPDMINQRTQRSIWTHPDSRFVPALAASAARAFHAGVLLTVGSHGDFGGLGYQWTLWGQADGGLTPLEALRMATVNGAKALGIDHEVGTLAPGMLADFLVLDEDPLENIRNTAAIRYVVKGGIGYSSDTLNEAWNLR